MTALRLAENFRALFYAPFYAAHARDAYAAEGVEVEFVASASPLQSSGALREGALDVAWGGPYRVITAHAQQPDSDLLSFCSVVERDPFFIIGREPRPHFALADLSGVTLAAVAEVPTPWVCLQDDLRRAGVDPAAVRRTEDASMAENAAALAAGRIDAVQLFQPYAEELLEDGRHHLWYAAATRGLTAYTTLNTRRSVLARRGEELAAMTRAMARTLEWVQGAPAAEIVATVAPYFPDVPAPRAIAAIERYQALGLWSRTPVIAREGFERLAAAMLSAGQIAAPPDWQVCVDTTLAEAAVAALRGK